MGADERSCDAILAAGRADAIPEWSAGLWHIQKVVVTAPGAMPDGKRCPAGRYTALRRFTNSTLMTGGETVMADNPIELRKHLQAAMTARGAVLVTGLGLACVVRMLQANDRVRRITVVERDSDVIDLVWRHTPHDRCELIHADAMEYLNTAHRRWDYAWHDVWTDTDNGEPHLAVQHQLLMIQAMHRVRSQGAWAFPRHHKRAFDRTVKRLQSRKQGALNVRG